MTPAAKKQSAAALARKVKSAWSPPPPLENGTLLEQGLLCVLTRRLTPNQAVSTIGNLRDAFHDWNELRVSQAQEIVPLIASRAKNGASLLVARDVKVYLQEVFQNNHGFDLEFIREDLVEGGKLLAELPFLGAPGAHYLLWCATDGELPVTLDLVRVLDRLGQIQRTSSVKKARALIEPLAPKGKELEFAIAFATVVENWCERKKPTCWECPLQADCPYGAKVVKEWKVQQERLAVQRKREAERAEAQRKKEEAKAAREEARRHREAEKRARKLQREQEKKAREEERKRAAAEKKKAADEAKKKRAAEAAKKAAAKKKADAKKKAAAKKAAAKKKAGKKKSSRTTGSKKRTTRSKASRKSTSSKKKTTASRKKTSSKKSSPKKTSSKKKSSKKPAARKKTTGKKKSSKKPARKSTGSRKTSSKKKTSRKR